MSYELMKRETASEISGSEQFMDVVVAVAGLKQLVPTIRVKDDAQKAVAAETRAQVHTLKKDLEAMRKSAKGPYLEMGKVVDNIFKPFLVDCDTMLKHIDGEYLPYVKDQEFIIAEEQKRAMAAQIEASNVSETEAKAKMMTPSNVTDTDSGKTIVQDDLTVEIVNDVKFFRAVMDGRNTIPMKEMFEKMTPAVMPLLKQLCRGEMYSAKKWAKYGVRVVRTRKVQSRT